MSLLDDLKAKADANGDGKIDAADLEALRGGGEEGGDSMIDKLKAVADQNDDGKINLDDVKNIDVAGSVSEMKDKLFGN